MTDSDFCSQDIGASFCPIAVSVAACGRLPVPPRGDGAVVFGALHLLGGLLAGPVVRLVDRNLLVQVLRLKLLDQFIQAILGDAFGDRGVAEHQQRAEKELQNKETKTREATCRLEQDRELCESQDHVYHLQTDPRHAAAGQV